MGRPAQTFVAYKQPQNSLVSTTQHKIKFKLCYPDEREVEMALDIETEEGNSLHFDDYYQVPENLQK
jgi:hypothetical protein